MHFWEDFSRPKIVYQELTQGSCFAMDSEGKFFVSNTAYLLTGEHLDYLLMALNSKIFEWAFKRCYSVSLGESGVRWLAQCIIKLPVPSKKAYEYSQFAQNDNYSFEDKLYELLRLSEEERDFIESR